MTMLKRGSLSRLNIRSKLFLSYLLVISLPFVLLLVIHLNLTQQENEDQMLFSAHKMLDETKSYIEYKAQAITEILNFVAFNDLVQSNVSTDAKKYEDVNLWGTDANKLAKVLSQFRNNEDITTLQIYMKEGLGKAAESPDYLNMGKIESTPWFDSYSQSYDSFAWLPTSAIDEQVNPDSSNISLLRKIPKNHNIHQFDGIVRAQIKPDAMQSVLDHAVITPNTQAILFNEGLDILGTSNGFHLSQEELATMLDGQSSDPIGDREWNEHLMIGKKRMLFGVQDIPHTDMLVALLVPYEDILASSNKSRNRIITIFLIVIPFALIISYFVAASATRRIRELISHIRKVKNGHFQLMPLPIVEDEIGELARNFNGMVSNISQLMEETYTLGQEVKNKELKALQAQINPHFLYNTLNLIKVMAIESSSGEISKIVDELAVFYRLSLSNGREIVTLENELKHIESYVSIQNMRYNGSFKLELEVSRELFTCQMPKILLQPIVENAILHGIMETEEESGTICIRARSDGENLCIVIEDDGIGMTEEKVKRLFTDPLTKEAGGYGLRNIEERIRLSYGIQYGVQFVSEPGVGTKVTLCLPDSRSLIENIS
ncbi:two-component system sensor histidine kinase YesM [Paenibacillus phyllosphaerae]|uniref:histidine kinase n=1 Tax=Paenibacillus phyllosphaerae TaxID=274593 RepID=A0A7W5AT25_9BACL|nr:sensor histidine kinase [Paenibacillus phyllosphaerae]MBB3108142.1 two-component system sensor histidine kinase YesM [Paenibacillus phyllosphaerae]